MKPPASNAPVPGPGRDVAPSLVSTLTFFLPYLKKARWKLATLALLLVVCGAIPVALAHIPALLGGFWNSEPHVLFGYTARSIDWLTFALMGFITLIVIGAALQFLQQALSNQIAESITRNLRMDVVEKIGVSTQGDSPQTIGQLAQKLTQDVSGLRYLLVPSLVVALFNLIVLIFSLIALAWRAPLAALGLVALAPVILLILRQLQSWLVRSAHEERECEGLVLNEFVEGAAGYRDLAVTGRFAEFCQRFGTLLDRRMMLSLRTARRGVFSGLIPSTMFVLGVLVYYLYSAWLGAQDGTLLSTVSPTSLVTATMLIMGMQGPILELSEFFARAHVSLPGMMALRRHLQLSLPRFGDDAVVDEHPLLQVENLTYRFVGRPDPILEDLSFQISSGHFVGLVGQSGSGKSTLAMLILRLLQIQQGSISIGNVDLSRLSLVGLHDSVGYIPQTPFIFSGSLRDNILLGLDPARVSSADFDRVVRTAQLDGLVRRRALDGGLDAPVGPFGASLSGGERQRVALARALLLRPKILICDEYTANVDVQTASLIHSALETDFADCTRLVISHQLYALKGADRILVLEGGRIADQGTAEELVKRPGLYQDLWRLQRI